ncbi:MAG: hypothetical protein KIG68_03730 [Oxalobacter sp.]|nr:hypothetical protein [Oxalobacter sp.]
MDSTQKKQVELDSINDRAIVYLTTMGDSCLPRNQIFTSEQKADSFIQDYFKTVLQNEETPNFYRNKDADGAVMYFTKKTNFLILNHGLPLLSQRS